MATFRASCAPFLSRRAQTPSPRKLSLRTCCQCWRMKSKSLERSWKIWKNLEFLGMVRDGDFLAEILGTSDHGWAWDRNTHEISSGAGFRPTLSLRLETLKVCVCVCVCDTWGFKCFFFWSTLAAGIAGVQKHVVAILVISITPCPRIVTHVTLQYPQKCTRKWITYLVTQPCPTTMLNYCC